ncbi:hypothetical protein D3C83_219480 [compost metagenome]
MYSAIATESASTRFSVGLCLAIAAATNSPLRSRNAVPERSRFVPFGPPRRSTEWQLEQFVS